MTTRFRVGTSSNSARMRKAGRRASTLR